MRNSHIVIDMCASIPINKLRKSLTEAVEVLRISKCSTKNVHKL